MLKRQRATENILLENLPERESVGLYCIIVILLYEE